MSLAEIQAREAEDAAHWKRIERLLTRMLGGVALVAVCVFSLAAYLDYRWTERCKAAGGVSVAKSKCVRPDAFIEVPR
jgi:hypothetical protein